ncbi:MAG: hypothetical protein EP329_12525 [Deltaproteobacteria bacterium]|nr:MAG: hypothetical protein EP329_12525 [Deltaproteobacteria bacterium]
MNGPALPAAFGPLYVAAACAYGAALLAELGPPRLRRALLALGLALHLAGLVLRGVAIAYFPLTSKFESFYAFALFVFAVLLVAERSGSRVHRLGLFVVGGTFYALTTLFPTALSEAPPLMRTVWYPLHVPASFLSYALWTSAAAAGLATLLGNRGPGPRRAMEDHAFWGFAIFSLSMIFGGAWGYVAWGAWFLWDPKLVWSLVAWLFYGAFVHLKYWPAGNAPRPKASLALVGFLVVMVTYVGTSFLFRHSSHSF